MRSTRSHGWGDINTNSLRARCRGVGPFTHPRHCTLSHITLISSVSWRVCLLASVILTHMECSVNLLVERGANAVGGGEWFVKFKGGLS
jgi:hypothetical protein